MAETYKSGEKVKYRLAEAMKECMKKAPVEKITVKEITEECGVTRQTFYRNFQDKYDLINWYFDKILIESFEHMGEGQTVYDTWHPPRNLWTDKSHVRLYPNLVNAHNHKIPALKFQKIRPVMFVAFLLVLLASDPAVQIVPSYHFLSH